MKFQLIEYRTKGLPISLWATIPDLYVSDFLKWLELSEFTMRSIEPSYRRFDLGDTMLSDLVAPRAWPSYRECCVFVRETVLLGER